MPSGSEIAISAIAVLRKSVLASDIRRMYGGIPAPSLDHPTVPDAHALRPAAATRIRPSTPVEPDTSAAATVAAGSDPSRSGPALPIAATQPPGPEPAEYPNQRFK